MFLATLLRFIMNTLNTHTFDKKFQNIEKVENPTTCVALLLESEKDPVCTISKQTRSTGARLIFIQLPMGKITVYEDSGKFFYDGSQKWNIVFGKDPVSMFMTQNDWVTIPWKKWDCNTTV